MTSRPVHYEMREAVPPEGGVRLELVVEGSVFAHAVADVTVLNDLQTVLGLDRQAVAEQLRRALLDTLTLPGRFIEITDITEDKTQPLRYSGRFTYRVRDEVTTGLVWYDVTASTTGPEELSPVIRNRMRLEVHQRLTSQGGVARALVDLQKTGPGQ